MSKTVQIQSPAQFSSLLSSSRIVVVDFYADWCGPCKAIAPVYEQLSSQLSRPNQITFTKVNTDNQQEIAQSYNITAMPTFLIFKQSREVTRIRGANPAQLSTAVQKLAAEASGYSSNSAGFGESSTSSSGAWLGASLPRGYTDVSDQVDVKGLDFLNVDSDFGNARTVFEPSAPGKAAKEGKDDHIESDTDEQLMMFIPFQTTLKVHTLHITSLPSQSNDDDEEAPMRPKTIQLYTNRSHVLGFDEAEDTPVTQTITLSPQDWDAKTATAKVELRFVKFQNVTSLVVFVVDGEGSGEKTRIDRLRIVGETGEKRSMGKLEKIGHEQGE
ncbi:hypothetical protein B0A49_06089 [Cryomyces minteri]|uniref:Thioredoxin-like protein 1 n=1 Tax=Cryomyces minteri TaxID=331657 RepID=A0A4U0XJ56_9PEZI|nr:hypothetical protein B0A49_06089 [Cryomyces minteri]